MKKYIIITLILLGLIQIGSQFDSIPKKTGHGIVEPTIRGNTISEIQNPDFQKLHKTLYPNDEYIAFQYTVKDEYNTIEFYIGDEMKMSSSADQSWGEIYILIKDNNELIIATKDVEVIDKFQFREIKTSSTTPLESIFPKDYEYVSTQTGRVVSPTEFRLGERIPLFTYIKGYRDEETSETIDIDASISILFKNE